MQDQRKKIAILGGGMGGIAAAFALTDPVGWDQRFEVTVYQMGWRLGGKGASGRQRDACDRILEHGLHVWLGFYDHSFAVMQKCYRELARRPEAPLATWDEAFKPHHRVVLMDEYKGQWYPWEFVFPADDTVPGPPVDNGPTLFGCLRHLVRWLHDYHRDASPVRQATSKRRNDLLRSFDWLQILEDDVKRGYHEIVDGLEELEDDAMMALLATAVALMERLDDDPSRHRKEQYQPIVHLFAEYRDHLQQTRPQDQIDADPPLRRFWILLELGVIIVAGALEDGVPSDGLKVINRFDMTEWLRRHGASDELSKSAPIRSLYDLAFGFERGDTSHWNMEAGTALWGFLCIVFAYKGAVMWKMQAGMGDTVFTPFYQVLKRRGVRFEFFHKVRNLGLAVDPATNRPIIGRIHIDRQVSLKDPSQPYEPLVMVQDLPCWPSEPCYEQLPDDQAEPLKALRQQGLDLESYYLDWKPAEQRELELGSDFDAVILAIPPGAHPFICKELLGSLPAWKSMVDKVQTTRTQGVQFWFRATLDELGWSGPSPIVGTYTEPLDTWADMPQLIERESWPPGAVKDIAYVCGPLIDDPQEPTVDQIESGKATDYPRKVYLTVRDSALAWLDSATALWPKAVGPTGFQYDLLATPGPAAGRERANLQFYRANLDPSERYVLSCKDSGRFRMKSDGSGVSNLFLAGDWTDNGFINAGCIEATTRSGEQAAAAVWAWAGGPA